MNDLSHASPELHRRAFLGYAGALVIGLATSDAWAQVQASSSASPNNPAMLATKLDSYLAIKTDGTVDVFFGGIDGGQGLATSIAQMVAEELDVDFVRINLGSGLID